MKTKRSGAVGKMEMPVDQATKHIDGNEIAAEIRTGIAKDVAIWKAEHAITPGLAVVLVGDDPASHVYVRNKARQTEAVGMKSYEHFVDGDVSLGELLDLVQRLNEDEGVHGILVQLPLPPHLDTGAVLDAITPEKDVDGFHFTNAGLLATGRDALVPCTPLGCMHLLRSVYSDLTGMNAVIVGRSNIVGKPMAQLLLQADCSVTVAHSRSRDLASICRTADILIVAVGRPGLVKRDWVKPGATVLDVGINRVIGDDGRARLAGDVDFEAVSKIAGAITPVPGGVGPMTIACLLANTLKACRRLTLDPQD